MFNPLRPVVLIALVTALWCLVITSVHGIWSFGIVHGYLDGGTVPLNPSWPVTYWGFFLDSFGAFAVPFVFIITFCIIAPSRYYLGIAMVAWLLGALSGANATAYIFQIDFGTTWAPLEALRELYIHPIVTPLAVIMGLAGTAYLTRSLRQTSA